MNDRCVICNYFSSEYGIRSRKFHYVEGDCICSDCYSSVASCLKEFDVEEVVPTPLENQETAVRSTSGLLDPILMEAIPDEKEVEDTRTLSEVRIE